MDHVSNSTTYADIVDIQGKDQILRAIKDEGSSVLTLYTILPMLLPALFGFIIGFFWNIQSRRANANQLNVDEINKKFNLMKNEAENLKVSLHNLMRVKYRIKIAQAVYYILLIIFSFILYKSDSLFDLFLHKHSIWTFIIVPLVLFALIGAEMIVNMRMKPKQEMTQRIEKDIKDSKKVLLRCLEPVLLKTLKDVVREEALKKKQLQNLSDEGCSEKCILINKMHKADLQRHQKLLNELTGYSFCDPCAKNLPEPCKQECGKKFFEYSKKHLQQFDKQNDQIVELKATIAKFDEKNLETKNFNEFMAEKKSEQIKNMKERGSSPALLGKEKQL